MDCDLPLLPEMIPCYSHTQSHTLNAVDDERVEGIPENCSLELGVAAGSGDKCLIIYIQGQLLGND